MRHMWLSAVPIVVGFVVALPIGWYADRHPPAPRRPARLRRHPLHDPVARPVRRAARPSGHRISQPDQRHHRTEHLCGRGHGAYRFRCIRVGFAGRARRCVSQRLLTRAAGPPGAAAACWAGPARRLASRRGQHRQPGQRGCADRCQQSRLAVHRRLPAHTSTPRSSSALQRSWSLASGVRSGARRAGSAAAVPWASARATGEGCAHERL